MPCFYLIEVDQGERLLQFSSLDTFFNFRSTRIEQAPTYLAQSFKRELKELEAVELELAKKAGAPETTFRGASLIFGSADRIRTQVRIPAVALALADPHSVFCVTASREKGIVGTLVISKFSTFRYSYSIRDILVPGL